MLSLLTSSSWERAGQEKGWKFPTEVNISDQFNKLCFSSRLMSDPLSHSVTQYFTAVGLVPTPSLLVMAIKKICKTHLIFLHIMICGIKSPNEKISCRTADTFLNRTSCHAAGWGESDEEPTLHPQNAHRSARVRIHNTQTHTQCHGLRVLNWLSFPGNTSSNT